MHPYLSDIAGEHARNAYEARGEWLDHQAALWVIFSEQVDKAAAKAIDVEMLQMFTMIAWNAKRQLFAGALDSIRQKNEQISQFMTSSISKQFERYAYDKDHWWSATQVLAAHSNEYLTKYNTRLEKTYTAESSRSTPTVIEESLKPWDLAVPAHNIEK